MYSHTSLGCILSVPSLTSTKSSNGITSCPITSLNKFSSWIDFIIVNRVDIICVHLVMIKLAAKVISLFLHYVIALGQNLIVLPIRLRVADSGLELHNSDIKLMIKLEILFGLVR